MYLFNRRVLKFFRKDGHQWRRKKDGRAIAEAHERLKVVLGILIFKFLDVNLLVVKIIPVFRYVKVVNDSFDVCVVNRWVTSRL